MAQRRSRTALIREGYEKRDDEFKTTTRNKYPTRMV